LTFAAGLIGAHVVPAVAVWAVLGVLLSFVPGPVALTAVVLYATLHGLAETLDLPIRPPGVDWQVPSSWLRGRGSAARLAIWGGALGPGLFTRNPFAGMWFALFALMVVDGLVFGAAAGAVVGLVHGTARAAGVLANLRHQHSPRLPWHMMMSQMRFRLADGLGLLGAGALIVTVAVAS
jgi:hypothetical protein